MSHKDDYPYIRAFFHVTGFAKNRILLSDTLSEARADGAPEDTIMWNMSNPFYPKGWVTINDIQDKQIKNLIEEKASLVKQGIELTEFNGDMVFDIK